MATVRAVVRKNKINGNGETSIYFRYRHKDNVILISSGIKILIKNWNEGKQKVNSVSGVKKNKLNVELINELVDSDELVNSRIFTAKTKILKISNALIIQKIEPTPHIVKSKFTETDEIKTHKSDEELIKLFNSFKDTSTKSEGTKANYQTAIYHLEKYEEKRKKKLHVRDVSLELYDDFKKFLFYEIEKPDESVGLSDNSVGTSIKNLKVLLRFLKKRGYPIPDILPDIKVPRIDTKIHFLTEDEIEKLSRHEFELQRLNDVRDVFVFNCFTGLRFSDLKRLNKNHIVNDRIRMRAYKNQKDIYVPLVKRTKAILEKHDYELPIVSEQKFNDYIKEACEEAGIKQQVEVIKRAAGEKTIKYLPKYKVITSHIAVKTFISLCGKKGVSPKLVSEITGKSVEILIKHYYGIDEDTIDEQMKRAFG